MKSAIKLLRDKGEVIYQGDPYKDSGIIWEER